MAKGNKSLGMVRPSQKTWASKIAYSPVRLVKRSCLSKDLKHSKGTEGAIEFSPHGYDWLIEEDDHPKYLHQPSDGDILLFPSSLFIGLYRFKVTKKRCTIAFDLLPR